jgi:hypothetical protein
MSEKIHSAIILRFYEYRNSFQLFYQLFVALYCTPHELVDIDEAYLMMENRSEQRIIGLISGTSVDGIDAALIEVRDEEDTSLGLRHISLSGASSRAASRCRLPG